MHTGGCVVVLAGVWVTLALEVWVVGRDGPAAPVDGCSGVGLVITVHTKVAEGWHLHACLTRIHILLAHFPQS